VPDLRRAVGKIRGWILHGRNGIAFPARLDFQGLAWNQTSILISIGRLKRKPATQSGKAEVAAQALYPKAQAISAQLVGFNAFSSHMGLHAMTREAGRPCRTLLWQEKRRVKKSLSFLIRGLLLSQTSV
jgi:hypothetical protein